MRLKRNGLSTVAGFAALAALGALLPARAAAAPAGKEQVQRGEYLVRITGCNDCHTPMKMGPKGPEPDMTRMLTGHDSGLKMPPAPALSSPPWGWAGSMTMTAFAGPWGVSYSPNLTPDDETGLGKWTEQMFLDALRTGKHMGRGRPILPPMPWQGIGTATDGDLKAIYAYLRSLKPVRNAVPSPIEPVLAEK
jgi:mono/diheme cytochrome c family protein